MDFQPNDFKEVIDTLQDFTRGIYTFLKKYLFIPCADPYIWDDFYHQIHHFVAVVLLERWLVFTWFHYIRY